MMREKTKLKIGEFSQLMQVTVKTLRHYESFTEAFAYMEEQGYKLAGPLRTSYIDGAWNQEDPELWLSVIQIPIE